MKKILIIDDETSILQAITVALEMKGYEVETSTDGSRAETVVDSPPDIILLDMLLSGTDGGDVVKFLKGDPRTRDIPVIMFSAHPSAGAESKAVGADDFLAKPFGIYELLETIERNLIGRSGTAV